MRDRLVFYVNGARHEVRGEAAGRTLSDYLREGCGGPRLTGTKIACAEGDCGACTVLVGRPSDDNTRLEYQTIDACIAFVYQLDRTHVVTVEGMQCEDRLASVQAAMVDCHASQCGFCTPGFVMAMQGLVEENEGPLSDDALRLGLSGNLCRCTGYSQILDAGLSCDAQASERIAACYPADAMLDEFESLGAEGVHVNARPIEANGSAGDLPVEIFAPSTLEELLETRSSHPHAKLVSGATDVGVQFNHGKIAPTVVIYTKGVNELQSLTETKKNLLIGAGVSWSRIEDYAEQAIPEYHAILTRFGSPQVRHAGTLIGNLANGSPIADSLPFHYVAESILELASVRGKRSVPIEEFYLGYKQFDLADDEVIVSVRTPLPSEATHLKLYKISKRRDMDISTVTLAIWLETTGEKITTARLAAGGVGPTVVRLPLAEEALLDAELSLETLQDAGRIARGEVAPISDVRGSDAFRSQLIENLFAKCWHDLTSQQEVA